MGQVWLAEQTEPVRRQLALKLIRGGLYDDAVVQRFESERQSLAVMNHPAIAKVFDAGSTKDGQPYFVMEYVAGPPITRYCDNKKLNIRARLELFIRVCEGVQHAHQKAIIHRDLKPSNILVEEVDEKPTPRIIDFGIAKAISSQSGSEETMVTRAGALVGTPGFMSPEQADSSVLDVDTRTDVYSLGVVLYVLLTGTLPFETKEWRKRPLYEQLQQLREEDPPSPSKKFDTATRSDPDSVTATAQARQTDPRELVHTLRGDLDWIATKALERDRSRRYGTPTELAEDLTRYLRNEPVRARPASPGYRLQKYVRRHRFGVGVAAGLALLLSGFAVLEAFQVRRITEERDRMDRVADFMRDMFASAAPSVAHKPNVTAREVLDKASTDLDSELYADPKFQALMKLYLGEVYMDMGLHPQAQKLLQSSLNIAKQAYGPNDLVTLDAGSSLAWSVQGEGRIAEAAALQQQVLDTDRRVLGPANPYTLSAMSHMSLILISENQYEQAEKLVRQTRELSRRTQGPESPTTLQATFVLAQVLQLRKHYAESEALLREILPIERRLWGADNTGTIDTMGLLSQDLHKQGRYAENEQLLQELLEAQNRIYGPEHPRTLATRTTLARTLRHEAKYDDAENIARGTLAIERRVNTPNHRDTAYAAETLGLILSSAGRYPEAKPLMQEAVQIDSKNGGPSDIILAWYNFACAAALGGRSDEALEYLQRSIDAGLQLTEHPEHDDDLKSLRADPRFLAMTQNLAQRAQAPGNAP